MVSKSVFLSGAVGLLLFFSFLLPHTVFAALSLDGTAHGNVANSPSATATLTTSQSNDVIILFAAANSAPVVSVSDTAGLHWNNRANAGGGQDIEEWYAIAASPLSSDVITVTQSASHFMTLNAFGVNGANTATPFDGSAVTGSSDPVSISTSNANTMIIGGIREGTQSTCTAGSGYTLLNGNDWAIAEYEIVSSTQSGLSVTQGASCSGTGQAEIADAIIQATPLPSGPSRIMRLFQGYRIKFVSGRIKII